MTSSSRYSGAVTVIWPEHTDDTDYHYEHAITVVEYEDSIGIEQNGQSITVPRYAVRELIKALRRAALEGEP